MEIPNQISAIVEIIKQDWKTPYPVARCCLDFMFWIEDISELYVDASAVKIVQNFLDDAETWEGQTARAVKQKLNQLIQEQKLKDQTI